MLKTFLYGIAFLSFAFNSASVVIVPKAKGSIALALAALPNSAGTSAVDASQQAESMNGFPLDRTVRAAIQPPLLTRDQLVTRGHAEDKEEITALFYTYIFFHDTNNGPGVASLFTKDGILESLWNNGGKTIEPNGDAPGHGCVFYGQDQIASEMFGTKSLPFPGHYHNQATNVLVQVHGDTATLYANWTTIQSNEEGASPLASAPNTAIVSHNGEYVSDLRRTPDGWRFVHHRAIQDVKLKIRNASIASCDQNFIQGR